MKLSPSLLSVLAATALLLEAAPAAATPSIHDFRVTIIGTVDDLTMTNGLSLDTMNSLGAGIGAEVGMNMGVNSAAGAGALDKLPTSSAGAAPPELQTYAYDSLEVRIGGEDAIGVTVSGFTANTETQVASDQTALDPTMQALCPPPDVTGLRECDWVRILGNDPAVMEAGGLLAFDDDILLGEQNGFNWVFVNSADTLPGPSFVPAEGTYLPSDLASNQLLTIDVIDLVHTAVGAPKARVRIFIAPTEIVVDVIENVVPSLSALPGALLVLTLLALGVGFLVFPARVRLD